MTRALILVDIQNDFMPGGNLAVENGNEVVPIANELIEDFSKSGDIIVTTQDFHPSNHGSFASNNDAEVMSIGTLDGLEQVMWPNHCVQGTDGCYFHPDLNTNKVDKNFPKGTNKDVDSYSGFFDNGKRGDTGLHQYLQDNNITEVVLCGLARDYCVAFTALDAVELGYNTSVIFDACRPVNFPENNDIKTIIKMVDAGINVVTSNEYFEGNETVDVSDLGEDNGNV